MGSAQSSEEKQRHDELLARLSGPEAIPFGPPPAPAQGDGDSETVLMGSFWDELVLAFAPEPLITLPPHEVDGKLRPACEQLLVHNPMTHNFQALVLHTVTLLGDAKDVKSRRAACNALRLITEVLVVASSTGNGASLVTSLFEVTPNLPIPPELAASAGSGQLLRLLVRRCLILVASLPATGSSYLLLLELLHLLLALMATSQLGASHVRGPPGSHPGVEALCSMQSLAPKVVSRLLLLYIYRPPPPEALAALTQATAGAQAHPHQQRTTLGAVASAASALLWLPVTTVTAIGGALASTASATPSGATASSGSAAAAAAATLLPQGGLGPGQPLAPSPLADLSLLLLLLLLHAPDQAPLGFNPFKFYGLRNLVNRPDHDLAEQLTRRTSGPGSTTTATTSASTALSQQLSAAAAGPSAQQAPGGGSGAAQQPKEGSEATVCFASLYQALAQALEAPALLAPAPPPVRSSGSGATGGPSGPPHQGGAAGEEGAAVAVTAWGSGAPLVSSGPEEAVSLLYLLLVNCADFKACVASHNDKRRLLVPLLRQLWAMAPAQQPRLLFMLQIILLVLSQDDAWAASIHHVNLPTGVPWCRELSKGVTLGSLMVMVLLRVISTCWSLNHTNDLLAPSNALAALANLAPHCTHLHARAAQRLMALLLALTKKLTRLGGLTGALGAPLPLAAALSGGAAGGAGGGPAAAQQAALAVLEDFVRIVLETINLCLTGPSNPVVAGGTSTGAVAAGFLGQGAEAVARSGQLASNVELVYALLHQQDTVAALRQHPRLGELADNLHRVVVFFNYRLDEAARAAASGGANAQDGGGASLLPTRQPDAAQASSGSAAPGGGGGAWSSADQVLRVLSSSVLEWRHDRARQLPQLRFAYEEEQEPDAFFVPLVWSLVMQRCGSLAWAEAQLALAQAGGAAASGLLDPSQHGGGDL